jgi:hypothetical protein
MRRKRFLPGRKIMNHGKTRETGAALIAGLMVFGALSIVSCNFFSSSLHGQASGATPAPAASGTAGASPSVSYSPSASPPTAAYTPLALLPAADGGPIGSWFNAENAVFKDLAGTDLIGFFPGATTLLAAASSDSGRSWRIVRPSPEFMIPCGSTSSNTLCQSPDGKVHILFGPTGYSGANYARLSVQRDGEGHIVNFQADLPPSSDGSGYPCVHMPAVNGVADVRKAIIAGYDSSGSPRLFFALYEYPGVSGHTGRIQACMSSVSASWAPDSESDWVSLSDGSGMTTVFLTDDGIGDPHNNGLHMAQHPLSRDLWFEWGPLNTGDSSNANMNPVRRLRATPQGSHAFACGAAEIADSFSATLGYECLSGSVVASADYVWFLHCSPDTGVVIDRADRYGTILKAAIPSPILGEGVAGDLAFSVSADGGRAWIGGWISFDSLTEAKAVLAMYWNGTEWTRFDDGSLEDTAGVAQSTGWNEGLVLVIPRWEDPRLISLATIRAP